MVLLLLLVATSLSTPKISSAQSNPEKPPGPAGNCQPSISREVRATGARSGFELLGNPAADGYLAVCGLDGKIYYRAHNTSSEAWENWKAVPAGSTCDSPATAECCGRLYFVVRGSDGQSLWFGWINLIDDSFSGWTLLSGATPSTPVLASDGSTLCLVVRGFDNRVYWRLYDCYSCFWSGWQVLPSGATCDAPAAFAILGQLHVVVRGTDGFSLWHCSVMASGSGFSGWQPVGGATARRPTLAGSQSRVLCLAVCGLDNRIYYNCWNGIGWDGWTSLPTGATGDMPGVGVANAALHVVVRGMDGYSLWSSSINLKTNDFSEWTRLSGSTLLAPSVSGQAPIPDSYTGTNLFIDPSMVELSDPPYKVGSTFDLCIIVGNVSDLAGVEFTLYWNRTVLSCVGLHDTLPWSPYFVAANVTENDFNSTHGRLWFVAISLPLASFIGSTTIRRITFQIMAAPTPPVNYLYSDVAFGPYGTDTLLCNSDAALIPCTVHNGEVYCLG